MVGVPMYGGQCSGMFTKSANDLASFAAVNGIQVVFHYLFNESLITRARNYIADEFMRSDCTHLMFIDSDIGFNAQDVIAAAYLARDGQDDMNIVCGPYPKKTIAWEKIKAAVDKGLADQNPNNLEQFVGDYVFNVVGATNEKGEKVVNLGEPIEVMESGTGFMCIQRKTFEVMTDTYPELLYKPDHIRTKHFDGQRRIMCFFDALVDRGTSHAEGLLIRYNKELLAAETEEHKADVVAKIENIIKNMDTASERYLSEDYMFCRYARDAGLKVWLCPWMQLQHVGSYIFGGSVISLAQNGLSLTADPSTMKN